jgi:hypothetical protein
MTADFQEQLFVVATVKEGTNGPFIALEPSGSLPVSFAPGSLSLALKEGIDLSEATAFAASFRKLVTAVIHTPK